MEIICESSLEEYARHFWKRQRSKNDQSDKYALADIDKGGDPRWWLWKKYPYKLPRPDNDCVEIARLDQGEVEGLQIHEYMVVDDWMQERDLVPEPKTRILRKLAEMCINRGYFDRPADDVHPKYYRKLMGVDSLKDVFVTDKPLIECVGPEEYEIIDGWGRLLAFAALVQQGHRFYSVESFVARRGGESPRLTTSIKVDS